MFLFLLIEAYQANLILKCALLKFIEFQEKSQLEYLICETSVKYFLFILISENLKKAGVLTQILWKKSKIYIYKQSNFILKKCQKLGLKY